MRLIMEDRFEEREKKARDVEEGEVVREGRTLGLGAGFDASTWF